MESQDTEDERDLADVESLGLDVNSLNTTATQVAAGEGST
jgi:hypothetical protein